VAVVNPVGHLHNVATHTAQIDRLSDGAGLLLPAAAGELRARGGVRMLGDLLVTAQPTPNMSVSVSAGLGFVPAPVAVGGTYTFPNDGPVNVGISAAHATLPRHDLVVARVQDSFYAGSANTGDLFVVSGVAAASPADPALPAGASYTVLARVVVGAGVTSIATGAITNLARPVQVLGGVLPVTATDVAAGLYPDQLRTHPTRGLERWDGTRWSTIAPLGVWVNDLFSISYGHPVGGFANPPSMGARSIAVPPGRQLTVELSVSYLSLASATNGYIQAYVGPSTDFVTRDAAVFSTGTGTAFVHGTKVSGSWENTTGADVTCQYSIAAACTSGAMSINAGLSGVVRLRRCIT
jgi:hypothetical protein